LNVKLLVHHVTSRLNGVKQCHNLMAWNYEWKTTII